MSVHDIYYDNSCNFNSYSCHNIFQQKLSKKGFIQTNSFFTKRDDDIDDNFFTRICDTIFYPTQFYYWCHHEGYISKHSNQVGWCFLWQNVILVLANYL